MLQDKDNHKNKNKGGEKTLGVHWGDYPNARGTLSPCVIPQATGNAILSGLLHQAVANSDNNQVSKIIDAIDYFK